MAQIQSGVLEKSKMFFCSAGQSKETFFYPLSAGHFYCDSAYRVERENFNSVLVTYIVRGTFSFPLGAREQTARSNDVAVIDCFGPHTYYTNDGFEAYWLHIGGCNSREVFAELINRRGSISAVDAASQEQIKDIYTLIKNNVQIGDVQMSLKLYGLIASLFGAGESTGGGDGMVSRAVDYISKNYGRRLTVEEVAGQVCLSPSQFSRQFRRQTGTPPYEYIMAVRLTRAKELLKNTGLPISKIAYQTGFAGDSNFIYFFKKNEGISPLKFRNMLF